MILKWIEYYYPILSNEVFIPQKHGDRRDRTIAFRREFEAVQGFYSLTRTADQLFYDLKKGIRDEGKVRAVLALVRKLRETIKDKPMVHTGSSINRQGELFQYQSDQKRLAGTMIDLEFIIQKCGSFSIPLTIHHVLKDVGSFVTGTHSLIFRWAEFTSAISGHAEAISTSHVIDLLKSDFGERDIREAKDYYTRILEEGTLDCVWSGGKIRTDLHIDHMFPFVALRNNDLWNLVPARATVNVRKSDGVPSFEVLHNPGVKDRIIHHWEGLMERHPRQFRSELQVSLLGRAAFREKDWKNAGYDQLFHISKYLIEDRGFSPWNLTLQA
ncbi:MAG: HNH endonuclease domain-containing protein [Bacteroidales bacterium]